MTIASAAILLFLILAPLGNIPVFLSLLRGMPAHRQRVVLVREVLIALGVLVAFLWGGRYSLELMPLPPHAVSVSTGLVLLLLGLPLFFPPPDGLVGALPGVVPLSVPKAAPH